MTATPRLIGYTPHPYLGGPVISGSPRARAMYLGQGQAAAIGEVSKFLSTPEGQKIIGEVSDAVLPIVTGIVEEATAQAAAVLKQIKCTLTPCKCAIQAWNAQWQAVAGVYEKEYNAAQDPISKWGIAKALSDELAKPYWSNRFGGKQKAPAGIMGGTTKPCGWKNPPSLTWQAKANAWMSAWEGPMVAAMAAGEKPTHTVKRGMPAWAPWAIGGAVLLALGAGAKMWKR
jgi:hypothetical protein